MARAAHQKTRFNVGRDGNAQIRPTSAAAAVKISRPRSNKNPACEICTEPPRTRNDWFPIKGCTHAYCNQCVAKYVASKLQDNVTRIVCPVPGCESGSLDPDYCRSILRPKLFQRWGNLLCEAAIPGDHKLYCPFKNCSALMILDDEGMQLITEAECPYCYRLFCARCRVPWHSGIACDRFQKLRKNEREEGDVLLKNLAVEKRWKRCPKCRIYVEKVTGCNGIRCRCGALFCYGCSGTQISPRDHYCRRCGWINYAWLVDILAIAFALLLVVWVVKLCKNFI